MAKVIIGAEVKVDGLDKAGQSVGSFKKQLREAQQDVINMADKFGLASKEAQAAAMKVAGLKDAIGDAKALADTFNPDKKFVALGGAVEGVVAGFSAFTGAMGLLGTESKEVEGLLLKVQSAMALQQGLSGIAGAVDSFKLLGASANKALAGIKTGIAVTGIGLLLIALGAIVAYWDDIKEAVSGVSAEQKRLNKLTAENLENEKKKLETIGSQDNVLKLQGKSEKFILGLKIRQTDEVIKATEQSILQNEIMTKAQVAAAERNRNILEGILKFTTAPLQAIIDGIDFIYKKITGKKLIDFDLAKSGASLFFDPVEAQKDGDATVAAQKEALEKLKNDRAGYQLSINSIDKTEKDKRDSDAKDADEKIKGQLKKEREQKEKLAALRREYQLKEKKDIEDYGAELAAIDAAQAQAELDRIYTNEKNKVEGKAELAQLALLDDPNSIENKIAKINADLELELFALAEGDLRRQILAKQASDAIVQIKGEEVEAKKKLSDLELERERQNVAMVGDLLGQLADIAGRHTVAGKALAVAQTVIQTYQGAMAAFTSFSTIPIVGYALGVVAAAATVAMGIKNIAKIVAVKVPGKGGGGVNAPSMSVGGVSAPIRPTAQTTQLNQGSISAVGNAANRVFVTETDMTNNQERIRRLNRAARIN